MAQAAMGAARTRFERLGDVRDVTRRKLDDLIALAESEEREQNDYEKEQATKYRQEIADTEDELLLLAADLEREDAALDVSKHLRSNEGDDENQIRRYARPAGSSRDGSVYRTFAEFARDQLITHEQFGNQILPLIGGNPAEVRAQAEERLERTLQNVTSTTVAGLIVPTHMTDILDIIDRSRPVVDSARKVPLDRGSMTYPIIGTRPTVIQQTAEKTEAGTVAPTVSSGTLNALTFLGATNVSWQAANWSNPDVLSLYFDLAAEAYARQTEAVACEAIETSAVGTVGTAAGRLGTAGTESFAQWRAAVTAGLGLIYTNTGARMHTNTLYLSGNRFFQLAGLGTDQVAQMSPLGNINASTMTGNFFGLQVVGSHGFDQDTAILGDSQALLVGENPGSPVEMRVIEPRIGGWEVGLIGAFNAVVFDVNRFIHLGTHL